MLTRELCWLGLTCLAFVPVAEGVPVQTSINWSPNRYTYYGDNLFWYAMGNTVAKNLFDGCPTATSALLLGCGDIRNMLETCKASPNAKHLMFSLNDINPSIIARNGLLLAACEEMDPSNSKDLDFLWSVWYNLELSKPHDRRLKQLVAKLLQEPDHGWFTFSVRTWKAVSEVLKSWLVEHSDLPDVETVKRERVARTEKYFGMRLPSRVRHLDLGKLVINPVTESLGPEKIIFEDAGAHWMDGSVHTDKRVKGNVMVPNITLLHHKTRKWLVHYGSCPFRAYLSAITKSDVKRAGRLGSACQNYLGLWVQELLSRARTGSINILLSAENALEYCG